ncbi:MAG: DUF6679 family protein [Pseudanabaenaceae cyanobacterium SKYGB_i_bin29]|nr:hypothetical protein [Pseudanabaenaceae cyanobacterium SKYG29]MDW8421509.1 DUF6679 family protein [Pseudanabaenaceae cyanobacterium SKYGB_i_bin29]
MLHRKIYQLCEAKSDVWIYLKDQGRLVERAKILDIEGDVVTIRYETEEEDEVCAWEEMVRLDSIGSISKRISSVPRTHVDPADIPTAEECHPSEQIRPDSEKK